MSQQPKPLSPMRRRAIDKLLIQYLELPERQQRDWLEQVRSRLPRLSQWVERLADDSHTVTLLDESVRRLASESVERIEVDVRQLRPGDQLGPWEVISEVGQGGMGRVYRGRRADGAFDMEVAIKQIGQRRRGLAEQLQRECRLLARLDHPSVTRLVDAGLDDQAGPFLVMEWVEGIDLPEWLTSKNPSTQARLGLFQQVAEAVAHAHQRLIVHGDIKPNNIRIRADGCVKLLDFGVARLLDSGEADDANVRALTPAFAAPEQRAGEDTTPASDTWSLGVLLNWLLIGEFAPAEPVARQSGLGKRHGLRDYELAAMINKACQQSPADRYPSVEEFLADLKRQKNLQPVSVLPATPGYRLGRFIRRNPVMVGGIGTTFFALSIGLLIAAWMYLEAEQAREQAEAHARQAEQVADFQAEQINRLNLPGFALDLREQLLSRGFEPPSGEQAFDLTEILLPLIDEHLLEASVNAIGVHFADQPLVKIQLLQQKVGIRRMLGLHQPAIEMQAKVDRLIGEHAPEQHPVRFAAAHHQALIHSQQGDREKALESNKRALTGRQHVLGANHPDTLNSQRNLARLLNDLGRQDEAEALYRQTLESRLQILGENHPDTLRSMMDIGNIYRQRNQPDQADPLLAQALETATQSFGLNSPLTADLKNVLGLVYLDLGRLEKGENLLAESLRLRTAMLGSGHPTTLVTRSNFALAQQHKGDFQSAVYHFEQAHKGYRTLYGDLHPHTLYVQSNLGTALVRTDDLEAAEHHLWQAVNGRKEVLGEEHPLTLVSISALTHLLVQMEDGEQALDLANHLYETRRRLIGEDNPATLVAMSHRGSALRAMGSLDEAYEVHKETYHRAAKVLAEGNPSIARHHANYARALEALGRYDEAITEVKQAIDSARMRLDNDHPFVRALKQDLQQWKARTP